MSDKKENCASCGAPFQKLGKDYVPCPNCGTGKHVPGALVCSCGEVNSKGDSYCQACGETLFRECPTCDKRYPKEAKYCKDCGTELSGASSANEEDDELEYEFDSEGCASGCVRYFAIAALLLGICGLSALIVWLIGQLLSGAPFPLS